MPELLLVVVLLGVCALPPLFLTFVKPKGVRRRAKEDWPASRPYDQTTQGAHARIAAHVHAEGVAGEARVGRRPS